MVRKFVFRTVALFGILAVLGGNTLLPSAARAEVPLNRAVIESLRNTVRLMLQNQAPRPAKINDAMAPGDALATARAALAELRFNDGSLARLGGQALFRFVPHSRTFQLSNGTLLLLVPPGRGQTRIQTPNAAAGIRGSALFVRYLPDTDVTLIGALTESGIEVANRDRSQNQPLRAGQIAVVVNNRIEKIYRFDLNTFYETSDLVKGLDLQHPLSPQSQVPLDQAIAAVRAETSEAVRAQVSLDAANGAPAETNQTVTLTQGAAPSTPSRSAAPNSSSPPSSTPLEPIVASPDANTPLAASLLKPAAASLPTAVPPTVALPTTPTVDTPSVNNPTLPGLSPSSPLVPAAAGDQSQAARAPGLNGTTPGLAGTTPGQSGSLAPGLAGTTPGLSVNAIGRGRNLVPTVNVNGTISP